MIRSRIRGTPRVPIPFAAVLHDRFGREHHGYPPSTELPL